MQTTKQWRNLLILEINEHRTHSLTGDSAKSPELEYNKRNCTRWNSSLTSWSSVLHISTSKGSKLKIRRVYCSTHAQIQLRYTVDLKHFHDSMLISLTSPSGDLWLTTCLYQKDAIWRQASHAMLFHLDSVFALNFPKSVLCKYHCYIQNRNTNIEI